MARFLSHIGPLTDRPGSPATTAWLLLPGEAGDFTILAPSLAEALPELIRQANGQTILCEPALAGHARACGLATGAWSDALRMEFLSIALDIGDRKVFSAIRDAALIWQFCRASGCFMQRLAAGWPPGDRVLALRNPKDGTRRQGVVIEGPGLVIPDHLPVLADPAVITDIDGIAAVFDRGEAAIRDALARILGLDSVPQPFRHREGEKLPVSEPELALLTAALYAVSALWPGTIGHGEVRTDHVSLEIWAGPATSGTTLSPFPAPGRLH